MEKETNQKKDIFDKIMSLPVLRAFEGVYKKNKSILLYIFFGGLTTLVSFLTAGAAKYFLEANSASDGVVAAVSTDFSWVCSVTFAYITNRIWVFGSQAKGKKGILTEAASFYGGRVFTLLAEMLMMWAGYSKLGFNYWATKIVANVVVLVLNYVISKVFVFRKKKDEKEG